MTFEADLTALLQTVTSRVKPDFAPVGTQRPYVTWQQIGGPVINPLDNQAPGRRCSEVQLTVWSDTRAESMALSRGIEDAMRAASSFTASPLAAAVADYDADVPVYGARQDFRCWHTT